MIYDDRYERSGAVFKRTEHKRRDTALAALEDLAGPVAASRRPEFDQLVSAKWRQALWNALANQPGVANNSNLADDLAPVFVLDRRTLVQLGRAKGRWVVTRVREKPSRT